LLTWASSRQTDRLPSTYCKPYPGTGPKPTELAEGPGSPKFTLVWKWVETPGDPSNTRVKAASKIKALVTGDAREATVLSVGGRHPGAPTGSCG